MGNIEKNFNHNYHEETGRFLILPRYACSKELSRRDLRYATRLTQFSTTENKKKHEGSASNVSSTNLSHKAKQALSKALSSNTKTTMLPFGNFADYVRNS